MKKADFGVFRSFMRGKSLAQIAEEKGIDIASVWKQIKRTIARLKKHGGIPLDLKVQQYLLLSHVVDEALEAFRESQQSGVRSVRTTTSTGHDNVKSKKLETRVTKDAGDPRFLEMALMAMKEIRDLFGIGAEAESKLRAAGR